MVVVAGGEVGRDVGKMMRGRNDDTKKRLSFH